MTKFLEAPEKLEEITGLSKKNRLAFVEKLRQNYGTERILAQLANYGIPNKLAFQIQDFYKEETPPDRGATALPIGGRYPRHGL